MKTIFNTCVEVTSKEQADRLKQVCIDNGLPIWDDFKFLKNNKEFRAFYFWDKVFCNWLENEYKEEITESEWMELLEQHNKEQVNELVKGKSIKEVLPEAFTESKSDILTELIDYATTNDNLWLKNQLEKLR